MSCKEYDDWVKNVNFTKKQIKKNDKEMKKKKKNP